MRAYVCIPRVLITFTYLSDARWGTRDEHDLPADIFFEHGPEGAREEAAEGEEGPEEEECGEAKDRHNQVQEHLEQIHGLWIVYKKWQIYSEMCLINKASCSHADIGLVCMSD